MASHTHIETTIPKGDSTLRDEEDEFESLSISSKQKGDQILSRMGTGDNGQLHLRPARIGGPNQEPLERQDRHHQLRRVLRHRARGLVTARKRATAHSMHTVLRQI